MIPSLMPRTGPTATIWNAPRPTDRSDALATPWSGTTIRVPTPISVTFSDLAGGPRTATGAAASVPAVSDER